MAFLALILKICFLLEIDFSKLSSFIKNSTNVAATLYSLADYRQADTKAAVRLLLFYLFKSEAQNDIVRIPIDEALRPHGNSSRLYMNLLAGVKDFREKSLPYVRGAVNLVMLSRSSKCRRGKCKERHPTAGIGREDDPVKGCYTIGQLYKSCSRKY